LYSLDLLPTDTKNPFYRQFSLIRHLVPMP
jgi:hypothetical protein